MSDIILFEPSITGTAILFSDLTVAGSQKSLLPRLPVKNVTVFDDFIPTHDFRIVKKRHDLFNERKYRNIHVPVITRTYDQICYWLKSIHFVDARNCCNVFFFPRYEEVIELQVFKDLRE
jgi:hypothetical protein